MPILYLLNYIELSYSEITFTYGTFDSKAGALSNFFQIDRIGEFINSADLEEVRQRAGLRIKSSICECSLRIAQFDVVKEIQNWHLVFFIFYILIFVFFVDSGIALTRMLPSTGIRVVNYFPKFYGPVLTFHYMDFLML